MGMTLHRLELRNAGLFLIIFLTCMAYAIPSQASEHITSQEFVEDAGGSWSLDEARTKRLTPFEGVLTRGYGAGAVWIRLHIDPLERHSQARDQLFLRIRPTYLDEIRVYDEADRFAPKPPIGDLHPSNEMSKLSTAYLMALPISEQPRDVWLRVQSTSSRNVLLEVMDESELKTSEFKIQHAGALYLTLMVFFVLWGLAQAIHQRDRLYFSFTICQITSLLHGATLLGYARYLTADKLPPEFVDRLMSLGSVLTVGAMTVFSQLLLYEIAPKKPRRASLLVVPAVACTLIGLQVAGYMRESLSINMVLVLLFPVLLLSLAITTLRNTPAVISTSLPMPKSALITYFGTSASATVFGAMPALGLVTGNAVSLYLLLFYGIASGLMMLLILTYRANFFARQHDALQTEARLANERATLENAQRLERERLLAMLGHELKTPLATLKMLLGDLRIPAPVASRLKDPVQEIEEAIEHTIQTDQVDSGSVQLRLEQRDVVDLVNTSLRQLLQLDRIELIFQPSDLRDRQVETDPYLFGVIFRNLVDNALKYSPEGSQVTLEIAQSATHLLSIVISNLVGAAGVPDPERAFDKYWRGPRATYRSGTGQGLYIASRLAQMLHATLNVESDGNVVRFRLDFPTRFSPATEDAA